VNCFFYQKLFAFLMVHGTFSLFTGKERKYDGTKDGTKLQVSHVP